MICDDKWKTQSFKPCHSLPSCVSGGLTCVPLKDCRFCFLADRHFAHSISTMTRFCGCRFEGLIAFEHLSRFARWNVSLFLLRFTCLVSVFHIFWAIVFGAVRGTLCAPTCANLEEKTHIYIYIYTHTHTHIYIYIYKHMAPTSALPWCKKKLGHPNPKLSKTRECCANVLARHPSVDRFPC